MRSGFAIAGTIVLLTAGAIAATAQEKTAPPPMTPEQKAEMEMYMKLATPGDHHKLLQPFVGEFDATTTMWETPGAPPQVSKGTSVNTWVLGGRYVQQLFKGEFMGMPFEGIGYTGYDNYRKKYLGTWIDTMGTTMMVSTGSADASGKVFTSSATIDDYATGKKATVRDVTRVVDANKHVMEMWGPDRSGKEFKMMEIVYTRR